MRELMGLALSQAVSSSQWSPGCGVLGGLAAVCFACLRVAGEGVASNAHGLLRVRATLASFITLVVGIDRQVPC